MAFLEAPGSATFDEIRAELLRIGVPFGEPSLNGWLEVCCWEETIRGVDAPVPVLTAGIEGKWSGQADESGISLADLADQNNDPREITPSGQQGSEAYRLAAKVWPQVQAAKSMSEASRILTAAGCRLHYFCAMD